jgi:hypothetical protein
MLLRGGTVTEEEPQGLTWRDLIFWLSTLGDSAGSPDRAPRTHPPAGEALADEASTAEKALLLNLCEQLGSIVFALCPSLPQVGLKRIHETGSSWLEPPFWWCVCSSQPGDGVPAQTRTPSNTSIAPSLGLERLDLLESCSSPHQSRLVLALPSRAR